MGTRTSKLIQFSKINIKTKRLILRPYKLTDFSKCKKSHQERLAVVNRFDGEILSCSANSYCKFKARVEKQRKQGRAKEHFVFAIFDRKEERYMGQVDLFMINSQLRWGNLGYQIQNQYWGAGFATEASLLALTVAFRDLGFHRIEAAADPKNRASIKVAKKIGMIYEGKRKNFFPDDGGTDMVVYGTNAIDFKF